MLVASPVICDLVLAGGLTPGLTCSGLATLPVRVGRGWRRDYGGRAGCADARPRGRPAAGVVGCLHRAVTGRQLLALAAEDLELLATAALLLGHVEDGLRALQRAHQRHAEGGEPRRAARCAFWLTFHFGARGDVAQASGWFGRANRLLEHEQECAEHGYLLISSHSTSSWRVRGGADCRGTSSRDRRSHR